MSDVRSDALVFFGATGDLAYKKIFPALQAMVEARPPRRAGRSASPRPAGTSSSSGARARDSLEKHGGARPGGVREAAAAAALRRRRLQRPGHVRARCSGELGDAQRPAHYLAIPPSMFGPVVEQLAQAGLRGRRARHRREAVRPRPRVGAGAEPRSCTACFPKSRDLPHRSLPRQGGGAEHPLLPLRQRVPRADLEPPLRRERADHDGRELRRAGPRQVLRRDRRRSATSSRTTCCRS